MRSFSLAVLEGQLEEPVVAKLLTALGLPVGDTRFIVKGSRSAFWRDIQRYNRAAEHIGPVLGLADLQGFPCPSGLIQKHLPLGKHSNLIVRVAERMLESWLLADAVSLANYMRISATRVPKDPDAERYPKQTLVNLASKSPHRELREDMIPEVGSLGVVGRGYTPRMVEYVERHWRPLAAQNRSQSLRRAIVAIKSATGA